MLSFHGDQAIKDKFTARVEAHKAADEIIQGAGWENGKGCAIGCMFDRYSHEAFVVELGGTLPVARLIDRIHEGLTPVESKEWPGRVISAMPVGRDLALVWPRFALWMLCDLVAKFAARAPKTAKACAGVAALYDRWIAGDKPSTEDWGKARSVADAADAAAADASDDDDAAYADAYAAADAAYAAAAAAADDDDAAYAAARRDARQKFWTDAAAKLEELLMSA